MGSEFALNFTYLLSAGSTSLYHLEFVCSIRLIKDCEFLKMSGGSKINKTKQKSVPVITGQKESQFDCILYTFCIKSK